jgi:ligand-binding sensor domain-containing protein
MLFKNKIGIGCFLCALIYTPTLSGQYKFEDPVVIDKEQGLPTTGILSFKKGKDGFIWMGTSEGISRFDGQQVRSFSLTQRVDAPPFTNSVNSVLPVEDKVWMGTAQGISVLDCKDYAFKHYQFSDSGKAKTISKRIDQQVSTLFCDRAGEIWIGTRDKGACLYDEAKDDFRFFSFSRKEFPSIFPSVGSDNSILSFEASRTNDSIVWAGTPGGLWEINKYTGHVTLFTFPKANKDYQIALNAFRRLYHHDDGLLYVGSWAAGVNVFDPVTRTLTPFPLRAKKNKNIEQGNWSHLPKRIMKCGSLRWPD